jgi:hypothetical protein
MKKENRKRILIISGIIILVILAILFGAKIYLYIRMLIGNDVIITIIPDKENLFLVHQQEQEINIKISALANLFCNVECNYTFMDISDDVIYENSTLNLKVTDSATKTYTITAPEKGTGQKLYRLETSCIAIKTYFCDTENKTNKDSVLITMDYNYTEQETLTKEQLKNEFYSYANKTNILNRTILTILENKKALEEKILDNTTLNISQLTKTNKELDKILGNITTLWKQDEFPEITSQLNHIQPILISQENITDELNNTIEKEIEQYNSFISNITQIQTELESYQLLNYTEKTSQLLDSTITDFNILKNYSKQKDFLINQNNRFLNFYENYTKTKIILQQEILNSTEKDYYSAVQIDNSTLGKIQKINNLTFVPKEYTLEEQNPQCCLFSECKDCCNESCYSDPKDYPIIFIHGHSFNAKISSEQALDSFEEMQIKLEKDNYTINAGSIIVNVPEATIKGIWGENPEPVSVKSSYYFDTIVNQTNFNTLQTKEDSIDTYAIRLKDIIDTVEYKTNREKVIIIAHSMGGLVTRRYMQLFGDDSLEKVILIGTPNHGIDQNTLALCKVFGAEKECDDMSENSILINKLENQKKPSVNVYNIIGIGCQTNGENGDGIITNSSAYLNWAQNYYVNGTCSDLTYLHTKLVLPKESPQTYEIVKSALKTI